MSDNFSMSALLERVMEKTKADVALIQSAGKRAIVSAVIAVLVVYGICGVLKAFLGIANPWVPGVLLGTFLLLIAVSAYRRKLAVMLKKPMRETLKRIDELKPTLNDEDVQQLDDISFVRITVGILMKHWLDAKTRLKRLAWAVFALTMVWIVILCISTVRWLFS